MSGIKTIIKYKYIYLKKKKKIRKEMWKILFSMYI
jgi:hypothetical protein